MRPSRRHRRPVPLSWTPIAITLGGISLAVASMAVVRNSPGTVQTPPVAQEPPGAVRQVQDPLPMAQAEPRTSVSGQVAITATVVADPPRLLYRDADLQRTAATLTAQERSELLAQAQSDLNDLIKQGSHGGFGTRNRMIDGALTVALLERLPVDVRPAGAENLTQSLVSAILTIAQEMQAETKVNPVNRGSLTVGLAVAYDLLHPHLTTAQRQRLAATLVEQAMIVVLDGVHRPQTSSKFAWWVQASSNWTTLILGGGVLSALAIRPEDAPSLVTVSDGAEGSVARSYEQVRGTLLRETMPWLERAFLPIIRNGGGTNEGNGYHHDMLLPLAMCLEAVRGAPIDAIPRDVAEPFMTQGLAAMAMQIQGFIHLATPLPGTDFDYGDGVWNMTDAPTAFLVADLARQAGASDWRAAAWQADQRCTKAGAARTVYRSRFAWAKRAAEDSRGMADFAPATIPTAAYLFSSTIAAAPPGSLPTPDILARYEPGVNEHQVIWRRSFTDPLAPALMFKGGDNRFDRHGALDIGTFSYVDQGVLWNRRPGWIKDYRLYWKDDRVDWSKRPFPCTFYHEYAKRAAGQNTLVVNPLANAYHDRAIPEPQTWLWQVNPDQAIGEDGISSPVGPVTDLSTPASGPWTGTVRYGAAYAQHGVVDDSQTGRTFRFEPISGTVEITDRLTFAKPTGNSAQWGMFLSQSVRPVVVTPRRVLLTARNGHDQDVYLVVERVDDGPGSFRAGSAEQTLPAGTPPPSILWRYASAESHRKRQKLVIDLPTLGREAHWTIRLRPLREAAGKPADEVLAGLP